MSLRIGRDARRLTLPALMVSIPFSFPHEASIAPFLNEIAVDLDRSTGVAGQLGTVTYLGGIASALAFAPLIGQMAIRRVLVLALIIVAVTSIVSSGIDDFALLLPIRLITGTAAGIVLAATLAAVARAWPDPKTRVVRTGMVIGAMAMGPGILAPSLRGVAALADWQTGLVVYGLVTAGVAVFVAFGLPSLPGTPSDFSYRDRLAEAGRAVVMPVIRSVLVMRIVSQVMFGALFAFLAAFFLDLYPGKDGWIAPMFFVGPVGFMLAAFVGGPTMARVGVIQATVWTTVFTSVAMIGFVWLTPTPYVSAFFFFMYGLLTGVAQTGMAALIYQHSGTREGAAIFVNSALGPGGSMIGALLAGIALVVASGYGGYQSLMTAVSIAMALTAVALFMSTRRVGEVAMARE